MKPLIFNKNYTRDTSILIQQIWARELSRGISEKKGWVNPFLPVIVHYMVDGTVEIWDNQEAITWLMDKLLAENLSNPEILLASIDRYKERLGEIKKFWAKDYAKDITEFNTYLALLPDLMFDFNLWYYTVVNEKTPKNLVDIILAIRKDDTFFASNDVYIIKSLSHIYPKIAGHENLVLLEEINSEPNIEIITARKNGAALIDGLELFLGKHDDFAKKYPKYQLNQEKVEGKVSSVKGQIAYKGIVTGKVRILRKREQVGGVEKGDIIVSPMTTPDFMPAMEKAAAFVTDEGGITCHAAIVARELKKPCIIGTKIATEVFKDGDMVEVDATKGIVTIVK
ncbi:MAG: hypothetical protein RL641_634 [Candidatus Parcubacteria bacterium]